MSRFNPYARPTPRPLPPPSPSMGMAGLGGAGLVPASPWETHWSDTGRPYYFNVLTNQSTWDTPPEVLMSLMMTMNSGVTGGLTGGSTGGAMRGPAAGLVNGQHPIRPGEPDCAFFIKSGSCKFGEGCKFNHPPERAGHGSNMNMARDPSSALATALVGPPAGLVNGQHPIRPGQPDCTFYLNSGACKYGECCKFNHPPEKAINAPTGLVNGKHPIRPGKADCTFFIKSGDCKFGEGCKFNHPPEKAYLTTSALTIQPVPMRTDMGGSDEHPVREGAPDCTFYMKTGQCKFGAACKFNHPPKGASYYMDAAAALGSIPTFPAGAQGLEGLMMGGAVGLPGQW